MGGGCGKNLVGRLLAGRSRKGFCKEEYRGWIRKMVGHATEALAHIGCAAPPALMDFEVDGCAALKWSPEILPEAPMRHYWQSLVGLPSLYRVISILSHSPLFISVSVPRDVAVRHRLHEC